MCTGITVSITITIGVYAIAGIVVIVRTVMVADTTIAISIGAVTVSRRASSSVGPTR